MYVVRLVEPEASSSGGGKGLWEAQGTSLGPKECNESERTVIPQTADRKRQLKISGFGGEPPTA